MAEPQERPLTARQRAFIREYRVDRNGTQAAIRAGYSKSTADVIASQNLAKIKIAREIQAVDAQAAEKADITRDKIAAMLLEDRQFARQCEAPAPAVTATTTLAKLYGLIDKQTGAIAVPTAGNMGYHTTPLAPGQSRVVIERQILEIFTGTIIENGDPDAT